jgi:predicted RNA-binding protein YlxR (DUF448 family)
MAARIDPAPQCLDVNRAAGDHIGAPGRPMRRCIVSGMSAESGRLIRFVVSPESVLVPDVEEKLPGRGLWIASQRSMIEIARRRRLFARAARATVAVADDIADRVEALLVRRCQALIGLAVRSGQAAFGHDKVREWLVRSRRGALVQASDGAPGERRRLQAMAPGWAVADALSGDELGAAIGRDRVVHGIILDCGLADSFLREVGRLAGFRTLEASGASQASTAQAGTT